MSGITDLDQLLRTLNPATCDQEFVFITQPHSDSSNAARQLAVATVWEAEGLTLVIPKQVADRNGESYSAVFRRITLRTHSSLEAVGLTAAISNQLFRFGIAANVIAGFHHDHVFVLTSKTDEAMLALKALNPTE